MRLNRARALQIAKALGLDSKQANLDKIIPLLEIAPSIASRNNALIGLDSKFDPIRIALEQLSRDVGTLEEAMQVILNTQVINDNDRLINRLAYDPLYQLDYADHFFRRTISSSAIGEMGWTSYGGGTFADQNGEAAHPGIFRVTTTNVSGNISGIVAGNNATDYTIMPDDFYRMVSIVRPKTVSGIRIRIGLFNSTPSSANPDGIYFEMVNGTSWDAVIQQSGTETRTSIPGITPTLDNWYKLDMIWVPGSHADFIINDDNRVESVLTNAPTSVLVWSFHAETTSAATKSADIDYSRLIGRQMELEEVFT